MSKLYVFGIGGTGSRVLKALTMMLSSGVECAVDTIVPIIIDPDDSAADKTRTVASMNLYMSIRENLDFSNADQNRFFKTEIMPVDGMENFGFPLKNTRDCLFKDFIKIDELNNANRALISLLFSEKNLNSDMKVGFKGNPNIGSVVLNQFANSQEYKDFANGFQQGDRIFIISSIFGGTGASGFPLLLKTLRSDRDSQSWNLINNAKIGAITVLPYFNVSQDDNSGVDSSTFASKTKSALAYYEHNISANGGVDALYYIGDNIPASYENHDGGSEQRNNAHIIELCSALAILKFAATPDSELSGDTLHYEYGLDTNNTDISQIIFSDLGRNTQVEIQKPMTQLLLMYKYLINECEKEYKHQPWAIDNNLDSSFFTGDFYKDLMKLLDSYREWLVEMADNNRAFKPFNIDRIKPLFDMVVGKAPAKMRKLSSNYALCDSILNSNWNRRNKAATREQKFIELFYRATKDLVEHKYNM